MTDLVAGYLRVSTVEQESGFGLDVQRERIERHCGDHGLVVSIWRQESKSGESFVHRTELQDALARLEEHAEAGGRSILVFHSLDRLTRDLIDQEVLVNRCWRQNIELMSTFASEQDVLRKEGQTDPMRTVIRQFFGIFNQFDKAVIQRRLDGGLRRKARAGGFTGGRPPYGYLARDRDLVIHADEAKVVRRIFCLWAAGSGAKAIASVLQGDGIRISAQTVRRVISNAPLYSQGKYCPRGGQETVVRPDLIIMGQMPEVLLNNDQEVELRTLAKRLAIDVKTIRRYLHSAGLPVRCRHSGVWVTAPVVQRTIEHFRSVQ